MISKNRYLIILLPLICLFIQVCKKAEPFYVSRMQLGTLINLTIIDTPDRAPILAKRVFDEIERVEGLMSPYRAKSDVYRINANAPHGPVSVSDETFGLLKRSLAISRETAGCFDITFASIAHLWDFKSKSFKLPLQSEITKGLKFVGSSNIRLDHKSKSVHFVQKPTKIGLGGIAKGYAIHRGIMLLKEEGVKSAIVEAGGDLQVLGNKFGKRWNVGLREPRGKSLLMSIELDEMDSIATSGDYERFHIYKGKRYHHIIDPRNGYPAKGLISVTVVSKDPVLSDAYATALLVMGKDSALRLLKKKKDMSGILVDSSMNIIASGDLKKRIELYKNIPVTWH